MAAARVEDNGVRWACAGRHALSGFDFAVLGHGCRLQFPHFPNGATRPRSGAGDPRSPSSLLRGSGHQRPASASLIPTTPRCLLHHRGMVPFKPVFLWAVSRRPAPRATKPRNCIRTKDIENVGRTARHHTIFECSATFRIGRTTFKGEGDCWGLGASTPKLFPASKIRPPVWWLPASAFDSEVVVDR